METIFDNINQKVMLICGDFNIDFLNPNKLKKTEEFFNTMPLLSILEKLVIQRLDNFTEKNNLTTDCQYGVRENRLMVIMQLTGKIINGTDNKKYIYKLPDLSDCVEVWGNTSNTYTLIITTIINITKESNQNSK